MSNLAIICVDDQDVVLESLTEQLKRNMGVDYEIEGAESGEEALEIIEELQADGIEVALIVCDQIMPGMKGDELLIQIHTQYPKILKIMLTGQANAQAVGNAVNAANLYRYIAKPWEETDLILTVREALRRYTQEQQLALQNEALKKLTASLEQKVAERTAELTKANAQLQQEILERQQAELALRLAQEKSEALILNILPKQIADQLKQYQGSLSERFDDATILLADIVDFTPLAAQISPLELVSLLGSIFSTFDELTEQHGLEKIKTIGDAYMVAGGLPVIRPDHGEAIAEIALDMQQAINRFKTNKGESFQMRIGINTGPVVAGVIGTKKFSYDLWGDTVNVAARMESSGIPGRIQVTAQTYDRLKDKYEFQERGVIEVKGKGEMITYWLMGRKINNYIELR
ncbi:MULTISPECIES: adenylate/guanylate cyclase domain-containing protein [unclassified Coleofasciculus]|uniref:adenylate/guanylate cyclase domain-containing protein n=1 Tax=unclassified Coleofasciculus TaxID=2692782 RepID=UPI00187F8E36|nr:MULTISPECIES: adenylate/guanylate cyclase domain-containing protein [unclassified Coleofasciculus]MBE9125434.1 response regulator [Coleofasciculus sp. LEGE 07081]MBE9147120.1 response regulator [Coleofasciculus sp. LEGE 07092]